MSYNNEYDEYEDFDFDIDFSDDLNAHKSKDKVKWILTAIAFLLVAVVLVGICLQVFGSGNAKPSEWFEKNEQTEIVTFTPTEMKSMRLNASRAVANGNTYTLTATVKPDDATNKAVTWDIAWRNPSSSWASGKAIASYITMSPSGNTATITLKTAFNEQAVITVRSVSESDVSAACTVDYIERLDVQHGGGYLDIQRIYQNMNTDKIFSFGTAMNIKSVAQYTDIGTIRGNLKFDRLKIEMSEDMKSYITGQVSGFNYKYATKIIDFEFSNGLVTNISVDNLTNFFSFMGDPSETSGKLRNAFISACNMGYKIKMSAQFTYSYDGTTIQSGQAIGNFTVNTNGLSITATEVNIDNSSLAF